MALNKLQKNANLLARAVKENKGEIQLSLCLCKFLFPDELLDG